MTAPNFDPDLSSFLKSALMMGLLFEQTTIRPHQMEWLSAGMVTFAMEEPAERQAELPIELTRNWLTGSEPSLAPCAPGSNAEESLWVSLTECQYYHFQEFFWLFRLFQGQLCRLPDTLSFEFMCSSALRN